MPIKVRIGYENFLLQPDDLAHLLISMSQHNEVEVRVEVKELLPEPSSDPSESARDSLTA